jgi:hypothetical protein
MWRDRGAPAQRCLTSALVGLALLAVGAAAAGEASEALARGRRLVLSFEYDAALEQLEAAVGDERATAAQRIEALELMGVLHFNLDRTARARQMFERLLAFDPGHELTDTSYPPRLIQFYAGVREAIMPQASVTVEARARQAPGGGVAVEVSVGGTTGGVEQAVTLVRVGEETNYRRALMTRDGTTFPAEIPTPPDVAEVEYYVEVQAPSGYVLARAGSPDAPLTTALVETASTVGGGPDTSTETEASTEQEEEIDRPRRRWYASWWFWTIVGVAVAGGAATAVVLTLPEEQEEGTLGTRSLP